MSVDVKLSGPLFEGRLDVQGGLKTGMDRIAAEGASLVRRQLAQRSRFRTPKYGHVADAVRTQVKALSGGDVGARIYLGGPAAFLGPILERGTRAHHSPRVRILGTGVRRRLGAALRTLRFSLGGGVLFRASVEHPGTPGYRWRAQAQAALEPQVQGILERALAERIAR